MNYEEDYYEDEREERKHKSSWIKSFQNILSKPDNDDYYEEDEEEAEYTEIKKPISIWTDVITLETAKQIIENLKNGEEQIINFENSESDTENDIRYFLYGAVYALEGTIDTISKSSIIIAPKGISIEKPNSKIRKSYFTNAFKVNGL